jgi:hypothetical protein
MKRAGSFRVRPWQAAVVVVATVAIVVPLALSATAKVDKTRFELFPNPTVVNCFTAAGQTAAAQVEVKRQHLNDTLKIKLSGFKPDLDFDLFTVQRSRLDANGNPATGFTGFGLAWYQSELHVGHDGRGEATIKTILLDEIFGFDPDVSLGPTNTFHVGFWFNNPADAASCGFSGSTPFNGEHNAGPLAMISVPDATTGLGPLCTDPSTTPGACNP